MNPVRQHVVPTSTRSGREDGEGSRRRVMGVAVGLCVGVSTLVWAEDPQPAQAVNLLPEEWTPYSVQQIDARDLKQTLDLTEAMNRRLAGVTLNAAQAIRCSRMCS